MPRRSFTLDEKRAIVAEYDTAARGTKAAVLRRELIPGSYITIWRRELMASGNVRACRIDGCDVRVFASELCARHYDRIVRGRTFPCLRCGGEPRFRQELCDPCIVQEFHSRGFALDGEYTGMKTRVLVRCLLCGESTTASLGYLRSGGGCNRCSPCQQCGFAVVGLRTLCSDCINTELAAKGLEVVRGPYEGTTTRMDVRCLACGQISYKTMHDIRKGSGCLGCDRRLRQEEARQVLAQIGLTMTGVYRGGDRPVAAVCSKGHPCAPRVSQVRYSLNRGVPVMGCIPCAVVWTADQRRVTEDEARAEFAAAGIEYLGRWVNTMEPVDARCMRCKRPKLARLNHIRMGTGGCRHCNAGPGEYHLRRFAESPELAQASGYLYLVEFKDFDGTLFHKVGIGRTGRQTDRLSKHRQYGARLIGRAFGRLRDCYIAEQTLKESVRDRRYVPMDGRIDGGYTECFTPRSSDSFNLQALIEQAQSADTAH